MVALYEGFGFSPEGTRELWWVLDRGVMWSDVFSKVHVFWIDWGAGCYIGSIKCLIQVRDYGLGSCYMLGSGEHMLWKGSISCNLAQQFVEELRCCRDEAAAEISFQKWNFYLQAFHFGSPWGLIIGYCGDCSDHPLPHQTVTSLGSGHDLVTQAGGCLSAPHEHAPPPLPGECRAQTAEGS